MTSQLLTATTATTTPDPTIRPSDQTGQNNTMTKTPPPHARGRPRLPASLTPRCIGRYP